MIKEYIFIRFFRGLAAFWVITAHCMIWSGWHGIPLPTAKIAVDLFMMISGFLMAANAYSRQAVEPLADLANWVPFWLRRFFRLAPAYYLSLLGVFLLQEHYLSGYRTLQGLNPASWVPGGTYDPNLMDYSFRNLVLHLTFLFGLDPLKSFSTFLPDWSLSLEMQFYLCFPLLVLFMQRFGVLRVAVLSGVASLITGFVISTSIRYREPSLLPLKFQYFLAGILAFHCLLTSTQGRQRILLAVLAVVLVSLELRYKRQVIIPPLLILAMLGFGWMEVSRKTPRWLERLLAARWIGFSSDASYGVYLFHGYLISLFGCLLPALMPEMGQRPFPRFGAMFLFVVPTAYLVAAIVYRWIEQPGIRLGSRLIRLYRSKAHGLG